MTVETQFKLNAQDEFCSLLSKIYSLLQVFSKLVVPR